MDRRRSRGYGLDNEFGVSLPLALVGLAFGVLLIAPLLSGVSTNLSASQRVDENMKIQYSSDAGAEYGIWMLENVTGFMDLVDDSGRSGVTVTLPSRVNALDPVVRVALAAQELRYALWGNSSYCTTNVEWTGEGNVINGNLHTNTGLRLVGFGNTLNGAVEYVTTLQVHGSTIYNPPPPHNPVQTYVQPMPMEWYMSDYDDPTAVGTPAHRAALAGKYHYIDGNLHINTSGEIFDGLYYVTGDIHLNGNNLSGTATFVARGLVEVNGNGNCFVPYCDQLSFFTDFEYDGSLRCSKPVMTINGSGGTTLGGVCYAPNGQIAISGSGIMNGSFLADSVDLAGSDLTINLPPPIGYPAGCKAYDVLSDVGGSSTIARVLYCSGVFDVLTWWLQ